LAAANSEICSDAFTEADFAVMVLSCCRYGRRREDQLRDDSFGPANC